MEHEESDELPIAPDTLPVDGQVFCFLSSDRPCSAECSAFKSAVKFNKFLDPHQQNCMLMQGVERASRSLNAIASILHDMSEATKKLQTDEKDRKMDEQRKFAGTPPQDPRVPS